MFSEDKIFSIPIPNNLEYHYCKKANDCFLQNRLNICKIRQQTDVINVKLVDELTELMQIR